MHSDLTAWLPGSSTPVREGVYERRVSDGSYSCWNGRTWNRDAETPAAAAGATEPSAFQNASWRGLAEPSNQPCVTCQGHTIIDRGHDDEAGVDRFDECPDC